MEFTSSHADDLARIEALAEANLERMRLVQDRVERLCGAHERQSPLAFVHIPKTAGGTVKAMLSNAYSKAAIHDAGNFLIDAEATTRRLARPAWERWQQRGGRVTVGHVPYGLYRRHLPAATRYMTFLREPVDRVLSHFHAHLRLTGTPDDERKLDEGRVRTATVEEALAPGPPEVCDLATRFLCGDSSPMGPLPAGALDDAKENLRSFAFVGIQERFEESVVLLQQFLDLGQVPFLDVHVTRERPRVADIPAEQRELILEHNLFDAELYAFGLALFEKRVVAAYDGFEADVAAVRAWVAGEGAEATRIAHAWLEREMPPGTVRLKDEVHAAADAAGIPAFALGHAIVSLAFKRDRDDAGRTRLIRKSGAAPWSSRRA